MKLKSIIERLLGIAQMERYRRRIERNEGEAVTPMTAQSEWNTLLGHDPEAPFWMVWNPQGHAPTYRHPSHESARLEAERLARLNPKQRFHVLEAKGCCTFDPQPVTWTQVDHGWVPF